MRIYSVLTLLALPATVAMGCGKADNDLWGSIDESFPLNFDRVEIFKQNLALRIEYIKEIQGGEDKVCKVVVNTGNVKIKNGTSLEEKRFADFTVTFERVAATGGNFPAISGGTIQFDTFEFKEGGTIDGDFSVVFEEVGGRQPNMFGNFDRKVKIVSTE
ncbi:MAG: hypothetical protein A2289_04075 [Deltaproteobacteria bacterium RIFOXYA12_FULL_58_15]|nr:MAG: hypothetical protein A2289_04075 [Deltaproteobacteria bacterium RIFOXYA12_FULL_58_15]